MDRRNISRVSQFLTMLLCAFPLAGQQPNADEPTLTLRATVRRVLVDVVVTDRDGDPISNLTPQDFSVFEDGEPQKMLSFDTHGFDKQMDYLPPNMPEQPPNTFVNLPKTPEKGPLYVLLYDLVNVEHTEDQVFARKELVTFMEDKPEGTRFAIFMLSDGLHLVQGFTSDKNLLFDAIDPKSSRAHVPMIFLMGKNFGQEDSGTSVWVLNYLASYLDGLPGRKNIIWFSAGFPLSLFANDEQNLPYQDEVRKTLALLAHDRIAIYPVDTRGVVVQNAHAPAGATGAGFGLSADSGNQASSASTTPSAGSAAAAGSIGPGAGGIGYSLLNSAYATGDELARVTGGRAFYSRNDLHVALRQATEDGESYYTLSYEPKSREYDGKLHKINVKMDRRGYSLGYRQAYYDIDPQVAQKPVHTPRGTGWTEPPAPRPAGDSLDANMQYGAPAVHGIIFGTHVEAVGPPAMGTPEQMAQLADQPAFFKSRRVTKPAKPVAAVPLQRYKIAYTVMAHQLHLDADASAPRLEIAVAAYDREGVRLSASVNVASSENATGAARQKAFRVEQEFLAPARATTLRLAVRDEHTDRIGAMEVRLPLQGQQRASTP